MHVNTIKIQFGDDCIVVFRARIDLKDFELADHRVGSSDHSDFFELNVQNVKATPMN